MILFLFQIFVLNLTLIQLLILFSHSDSDIAADSGSVSDSEFVSYCDSTSDSDSNSDCASDSDSDSTTDCF